MQIGSKSKAVQNMTFLFHEHKNERMLYKKTLYRYTSNVLYTEMYLLHLMSYTAVSEESVGFKEMFTEFPEKKKVTADFA
jgi:hypothetical protein